LRRFIADPDRKRGQVRWLLVARLHSNVVGLDRFARQDIGAINYILQFTHVTWPRIRRQRRQGRGAEFLFRLVQVIQLLQEEFAEGFHIFGPLAQRRNLDRKYIQPVK